MLPPIQDNASNVVSCTLVCLVSAPRKHGRDADRGKAKAAPFCAKRRQAGCPVAVLPRSHHARHRRGDGAARVVAQCHPHSRVRACRQKPFLAGPTIAREHRGQRFAALSGNGGSRRDASRLPHIGCWVDQHSFRNEAALAAEGRTSAKKLLEWGLHKRHVDARGNVWMLIPSSKLKVDWARTPPETPKKKTHKPRVPWGLPEDAPKHYAALMSASSEREVNVALSSLNLCDMQHSFRSWRDAAKAFDDWRCVLLGPAVNRWWQLHQIAQPEESSANPHTACLCFLCHNALGGDLASTCMHVRSTKDASMQASFPSPSDRAVNPARWLLPCCQGLGWIGLLILVTPPSPLFHCHHRQGRGYLPKTSRCRTFSVRRMLAITLLLSSAKVFHSRCCPRSNLLSCAQLLISLSSNGATCSWP